jgi:hypothetical protein
MVNLDAYVSRIVDATIHTGISRQVEAFKSGFNQVCYFMHYGCCFINSLRIVRGFPEENGGLILLYITPWSTACIVPGMI